MNYRGHMLATNAEGVVQGPVESDSGTESLRRVTVTEWLHEDLLKRAGLSGEIEPDVSETLLRNAA
jgi:hypothetical protein